MQGGELGRPDLLTYNKAHVHYNFGLWETKQEIKKNDKNLVRKSNSAGNRMLYSAAVSTPVGRERWIALSAPLRGIVTGDLSFGGFPLSFMKKFGPITKDETAYPTGEWTTPYNSLSEAFAPTEGFGFFMYGFDPTGDAKRNLGCTESGSYNTLNDLEYLSGKSGHKYGIRQTNGILELPFFTDSLGMEAHRTQVYDKATRKSTFYYVSDGTLGAFNTFTGKTEHIYREEHNGNFRFIPEERDLNGWKFKNPIRHNVNGLKPGNEFLVGNPYMSSIDILKFCKENAASVEPEFHIWNGVSFESYKVDLVNNTVTSAVPDVTRYIAPLQGFFLTYKGGEVLFDVEKISTVRPTGAPSNLRNASITSEKNTLRIKAENDYAASYALIGHREGAGKGFARGKDVQKLFSPYNYVPEVYLLAGDIPVDIHYINNAVERIVPIGLKTDQLGNVTFTLTGADSYGSTTQIILTDIKLNREIDISGLPSFTYSFDNQIKGIQNDRFYIRFIPSITTLSSTPNEEYIQIYTNESSIVVHTPSFDPIREIRVFDLQGRTLFEKTFSGINTCRIARNFENACVVVRVKTKDRVKNEKVVVAP